MSISTGMKAALATTLLAASAGAQAGVYLTGGGNITQFDYSNIDNATGYHLGIGYRVADNVALEVRYFDSGEADIEDDGSLATEFPGLTFSNLNAVVSGFAATVAYVMPLSDSGSNLFFRGGVYSSETELSITVVGFGSGSESQDTTNVTLGMGFDWMLTPSFGLRGAVDGLFGNKDFFNDETVTQFSLGLVWSFADAK